MVTNVPTLKFQTQVNKPTVVSLNTGNQQVLQQSQNLAQHNMSVAFGAWEKQVEYASRIQGAREGSRPDFKPEDLPKANTVADQAYRAGATATYGVRLDAETRASLSGISQRYQSPAEAAVAMDGYIDETSKRLPEQMLEPYMRSAFEEKSRILDAKLAKQEQLRIQSIKDQKDLDRFTLLRDVQTGNRPVADALERLQASYAMEVANGISTPAGAYRDYLKDVDDFTVAAAVPYYAEGNIVGRMTELMNDNAIPVELKNKIATEAFQIGRARRQERDAAAEAYDKQRERQFNARINNMILNYRDNNPLAPASIDATTQGYVQQGWNPELARQQAINDASTYQVRQKNELRNMIAENSDRLSPSASQAILNLAEDEANRPLTYDDPSIMFALNRVERENGYVPTELLNRYIGNGLSYESEARYRARSDEKYQEVFSSTGWKNAMTQIDVKFPEPTNTLSLGNGIKISTPKWGEGTGDQELINQRNAIIGRLTDLAVANPSLVSDPTRYKEWNDVVNQTFSTYGQAGQSKYVSDVKSKAESVLGQYGGFEGFKSGFENGTITEEQFREVYKENGGLLREYESLRKEGKIQ